MGEAGLCRGVSLVCCILLPLRCRRCPIDRIHRFHKARLLAVGCHSEGRSMAVGVDWGVPFAVEPVAYIPTS